jgi:hypothetical protein
MQKVKSINDRKVEGFRDTMHFIMDSLYAEKGGYHPTMEVKKIFKGKMTSDSKIDIKSNWGLCDVFFEKDSEYVVFGYFDKDGQIQTSVCTPTTLLTDKKFLRRVEKLN